MKKLLALSLTLSLFACGNSDVITCGEYDVEFQSITPDAITIIINGDAVDLASSISADGARYSGVLNETEITMWNRGDDWTLYLDDDEIYDCK